MKSAFRALTWYEALMVTLVQVMREKSYNMNYRIKRRERINVDLSLWIHTWGKLYVEFRLLSHWVMADLSFYRWDQLRTCIYWKWGETTKEREKRQTFPGRPPAGPAPACWLTNWLVLLKARPATINHWSKLCWQRCPCFSNKGKHPMWRWKLSSSTKWDRME